MRSRSKWGALAGAILGSLLGLTSACAQASPLGPAPSSSQPPPEAPFTWRADRPLAWTDFQGTAGGASSSGPLPAGLTRELRWWPAHEAAETVTVVTGPSYHFSYRCAQASGGWSCTITTMDVQGGAAQFDPMRSWAISQDESPQLLHHEQGHFDIAAVYAAQLRSRLQQTLAGLVGAALQGPNQSAAEAAARARVDAAASQVQRQVSADMTAEQDRYDAETNHGLDRAAQDRWSAYFLTVLGPH